MAEEMWKINKDTSEARVTNEINTSSRIQLQLHAQKRKRKRTHPIASSSILSGSSSSSSDDEDDEVPFTADNAFSHATSDHRLQEQESSKPQPNRQMHQPEGWRVKLYRLNADGSWDDCGTGRIVCLYKTSSSGAGAGDSPHEQIYQELGEPTLCMQAESSPPRVLLRTKILLRDAYQRQGDNIITWCEPYFEDSSSQHQDGQPQGVSLRPIDKSHWRSEWKKFSQLFPPFRLIWHFRFRTMRDAWTFGDRSLRSNRGLQIGFARTGCFPSQTAHRRLHKHHPKPCPLLPIWLKRWPRLTMQVYKDSNSMQCGLMWLQKLHRIISNTH